jgi:hypothetical protein
MMYFMAFKGLSYVYYSFYEREAMALLIIQMLDGTHGYRKTYHSSSVCKWQNILLTRCWYFPRNFSKDKMRQLYTNSLTW